MTARLKCIPLLALIASVLASGYVFAQDRDQAYRLGAFAGAMKYCEERHDGSERRFRWAQMRAFQEISDMGRTDRMRAMGARERAFERGQFFGETLNPRACERLLRMGEWQRFRNN